jgi:glutamate racemase
MKMNNKYIGVFDSGLGGLTFVKELINKLPDENIVYFGDTGRVPYGTRSKETLIKYTNSDINFLKTHDIKLIVIACGTVSSVVMEHLNEDLKVIGVVEPTSIKAAKVTKNKKIGIIGTNATIKSKKYEETIKKLDPSIKTVSAPCPLFVPFVENGMAESEAAYLVAKEYLDIFKKEGVDTLILGCTHYPLLAKTIKRVLGDSITLIDSGASTAMYVKEYLEKNDMLAGKKQKEQYKYFVSDSTSDFSKIANLFLGKNIDNLVEKIDIEKY